MQQPPALIHYKNMLNINLGKLSLLGYHEDDSTMDDSMVTKIEKFDIYDIDDLSGKTLDELSEYIDKIRNECGNVGHLQEDVDGYDGTVTWTYQIPREETDEELALRKKSYRVEAWNRWKKEYDRTIFMRDKYQTEVDRIISKMNEETDKLRELAERHGFRLEKIT